MKTRETPISKTIKELRKERGLTQKQLASETGIGYGSIVDYENGRREPNSKAMAALERFFNVSGEFLRGEVDRTTFLENSAAIQGQLDDLIASFQDFKQVFDRSSQAHQMQAVSVLSGIIHTVNQQLLNDDAILDLDADEVCRIFSSALLLNADGRSELAKRATELTQLAQYQN